jgi:hypothetical protein
MDRLLISAFDLYYNYIETNDIPAESLIVIDSGGYECRDEYDDSSIYRKHYTSIDEPWDESIFLKTLSILPDEPRFVYVSYDNNDYVAAQIHRAIAQMFRFKKAKRTFLLKPSRYAAASNESGRSGAFSSTLSELRHQITDLGFFDIIGVTEKDLGDSYAQRLTNLVLLKQILSQSKKKLPIHVFGSLDPLSVRMYFAAGADIFDGLTWLRFAYKDNSCIYINHAVLDGTIDLDESIDESSEALLSRNCAMLSTLQETLVQYRSTGNWTALGIEPSLADKTRRVLDEARINPLFS